MTPPPEREQRAKEIFLKAAALPPDRRAAFLDRECGDDAELRAEVESLLAQEGAPTPPVIDSGADGTDASAFAPDASTLKDDTGAAEAGDPMVGRRLGKFHIQGVIASGGMGTVYRAMEDFPRRIVALKVMRKGIASRTALRRFEFEAQTLARLRHPGIAQIYEAGTHREGEEQVPYFAMEYVPNARPITAHADEKKLDTRQRLALFEKVCDAVHHGHQKGIIHRDLKPGNILVDSSGQPKIIDFGVARSTDSDQAVTTLQSAVGQIIGTLQYMSPEQCEADPSDIDIRCDVYALGVVLYEIVCGRLPYDLSRAAALEAMRVIRDESPPRPSTISRILRGGDIETITLKAMEKDRQRRYASAAEFGADIGRYLRNEAIMARPPSLAYQISTFARRNRTVFTFTMAVVATLIVGVIGTTLGMLGQRSLRIEAERAEQMATMAERRSRLAVQALLAEVTQSAPPGLLLNNAAWALLNWGDYANAELLFRQELESGNVASSHGLGRALLLQGRYSESEPYLRQWLEVRGGTGGTEWGVQVEADLALVAWRSGKREEAITLARRVQEALDTFDTFNDSHLVMMFRLGTVFTDAGMFSDAESILLRACALAEKRFDGLDAWGRLQLSTCLQNLAAMYRSWDRREPSAEHAHKAKHWESRAAKESFEPLRR